MNLTNQHRSQIVNAIMLDVPEVDYAPERARIIQEAVACALPSPVKAVYDDPQLREYLAKSWIFLGNDDFGEDIFYGLLDRERLIIESDEALMAKLEELSTKYYKQREERQDLRTKLFKVLDGCKTLKQAEKLLPEFVKYFPPKSVGKTEKPHVQTNLVAALMAAGWSRVAT